MIYQMVQEEDGEDDEDEDEEDERKRTKQKWEDVKYTQREKRENPRVQCTPSGHLNEGQQELERERERETRVVMQFI